MNSSIGTRTALLAVLVVATLHGNAAAQTAAEITCRDAISKNLGKFVSTAMSDLSRCHQKRSSGKLPLATDCNNVFSIPGNKSVDRYETSAAAMRAACPNDLGVLLAEYARCPSPHSTLDDDGATYGIDDFGEATSCVLNLAATLANGATATVLGRPDQLPSAAAAKCQRALGKSLRKRVKTIGKARRSCQLLADRSATGLGYHCAGYDDGKIADDLLDLEELLSDDCNVPQDELVPLGACGQTAEQLVECTGTISSMLGGGLVAEAYELPASCKLGFAALSIHAGNGTRRTSTNFDVGYKGLGHGVDLLDGFRGAVDLACNADCVDCQVTINPIKDLPQGFCRCDSDPTIHCDTINAADVDDCGGGHCSCLFAPPLALSAAGAPTCVVNKLVAELDGIADGGTGVATTTVYNTSVVYTGLSQVQPCPLCSGDAAPNDGLLDGTCEGGARDGLACDANGFSPDFGPVSYECLPRPGANISGAGLKLRFEVSSVDAPMIGTDLLDGAKPVYCLQCSGDTAVACSSDAVCAELGVGTCSVNTGPPASANACDDGLCSSTGPTDTGSCIANQADSFCDGLLRVNGRGLLPCISDDDCAALDTVCPNGSCGTCSFAQLRSCLPDPFHAVGSDGAVNSTASSGFYGADLVSTFCIPATANPGVNDSVGLPGPGRLRLNFDFEGRCASDNSVPFELPGGSNCP